MLRTIENAGSVLNLFTIGRPVWKLADIADALDLPASSVHALLSSLVEVGLLRVRQRGRYEIGWRVLEMSRGPGPTDDGVPVAAPLLEMLARETDESFHYCALHRWSVQCRYWAGGEAVIKIFGPRTTDLFDPLASAAGKVLLAHRDSEEVRRFVLDRQVPQRMEGRSAALGAIQAELDRAREDGYALDHERTIPGVHCVAAPVRDGLSSVVAAAAVAVPACRFEERRSGVVDAVIEVADRISSMLGRAHRS